MKEIRPFVFGLVIAVAATIGLAPTVPAFAADGPDPAFLAPEPAADVACSEEAATPTIEELFGTPEASDLACGTCINRCTSDSQCVPLCGNVAGSCARVNSCCRQCLCST